MKIIFSFVLSVLFSFTAFAASAPSDQMTKTSCQTNGVVSVCRGLQTFYSLASLDIYYNGTLLKSPGLVAWIKVNYTDGSRDAAFPMELQDADSKAHVRVTGGCLIGKDGGCAQVGTAEMRNLLIWAQQSDINKLNVLDFEIAIADSAGNWDSNGRAGGTYHFNFPEN